MFKTRKRNSIQRALYCIEWMSNFGRQVKKFDGNGCGNLPSYKLYKLPLCCDLI